MNQDFEKYSQEKSNEWSPKIFLMYKVLGPWININTYFNFF